MKEFKATKHIIIITTTCVVFVLLSTFYHHIDKYLTGIIFILLTLLIPATFILILGYVIKGLIDIFRERKNLTFKFCLPTIIALTSLTYIIFSPWQLDSENLESKVEFRACYEGTQNQSYIKFRKDKSFEINSTGVFFSDYWFTGQWRKNGDTIFMKFDKERPRLLSDTIVIRNEYLVPVNELYNDSIIRYNKFYYLGYCRGLN
ncbi:hypothetical protein [Flavobacterium sp. UBA6031]|uniref:hypothetical protein n=1 Tax=Flavobacterium sp. UBA6031 TaxID=1946551 RepID=UPI0025C40827|nr:hypothetical protein [Flavobacterium sp. UBA6031]